MIIECPYCSTRFRFDESSVLQRRPTLRCSQCRRTFPSPPPPELDDDDLALTYDDDPDPDDEDPPAPAPQTYRPEQFPLPIERGGDDDAQPSLFGPVDVDWDGGAVDYSIDEPDAGSDDDEPYYDDPEETKLSPTGKIRPMLAFLLFVVSGYALLAWTLRTEPEWTHNLMQQIPILGGEVRAGRLGRQITLTDMRGRYERTKDGSRIFLVTGNARNEHDEPVRDIRVELRLLDGNGVAIVQQSTTCGNAMRADLVRDLTLEQVQILRRWGTRPPEEATINPGGSCPIVSIFVEVPDTITDFSGEVVQARRLA